MTVRRVEPEEFDWTSGSGGAEDVRRIAAAAAEHDRRDALNESAQLTLRNHGLDTAFLLLDDAGTGPVGFAYVRGLSGTSRPELDLVVEPDARRRGVGTRLAQAALEVLDGIPVTAWSHGDHPGAARIAERIEFEAARSLWLMRRDTAVPLPDARDPEGITIRSFRDEDAEGLLAVNSAAFAHHPEQGAMDRRELDERMAEDWFDAAGLFVAERDGEVVGFHWTKRHPDGTGEVYVIGVAPSTQGSGLGKAMLVKGLSHLAEQGSPEVLLFVEGDNEGAVALYEAYGFTHAARDTDVMYAPRD